MIWVYLVALYMWIRRLVVIPPADHPDVLRPIDIHESCPACGHRNGTIRFDRVNVSGHEMMPLVIHECQVCHCQWGSEALRAARYPVTTT